MKRWERVLLLLVVAWAGMELSGRLGLLLAVSTAMQPPPPFRIHRADVVLKGTPETMRVYCPRCHGGCLDFLPEPGLPGRPPCRQCHGRGFIEARTLGRPVEIVPIEDQTDYSQ